MRYDPAWLYAGDVMAKKDPFTARMFQRIREQMQERQKKQNDLKALAAKWLEQEPEPWDIAPLTPLSKEERSFWLDATFGQRYGRAAIEQDAYRSRRLVVASEEADNG